MGEVRATYRELDDVEKRAITQIKERGQLLFDSCSGAGREMALARTKIEEAVMWAVKGITG